ncbi:hypothetical protein B0H17DRAFT_1218079 [Mycena rosella]|uniref:Uncharacterized protein n=1 Tax=Mycena rosella TaxID=1033263 RepID=A0AAD7BT04_MYCRO|nr:hypothetical protein B0H17DRAFT_1218079 [Mycena rosella]
MSTTLSTAPTSFVPPAPAPAPVPHPSAAIYTGPRRRRTLRRAASVERYFALEDSAADASAAGDAGAASTAPSTAGTRTDILHVPINMSIPAYMQTHADAFLARAAPPVPPGERIRAWQAAGAGAASSGDAHRPMSAYPRSRAGAWGVWDADDDGGSFELPAHILDAAAPAPADADNDGGGFEPRAHILDATPALAAVPRMSAGGLHSTTAFLRLDNMVMFTEPRQATAKAAMDS